MSHHRERDEPPELQGLACESPSGSSLLWENLLKSSKKAKDYSRTSELALKSLK